LPANAAEPNNVGGSPSLTRPDRGPGGVHAIV
jgi:hypothetical protein